MPEGAEEGIRAQPAPGPAPCPTGEVFVSYASHDADTANALCAALECAGISSWIAPRDVRPGDFYADAIVRAIAAAAIFVIVLSRAAIDSPHVLREIERASSKNRRIIAFRIDAAPLPPGLEYFLSASQWLDATRGIPAGHFPKLIEAIRNQSMAAFKQDPSSGSHSRRRIGIAIAVALAALLVAALAYVTAGKLWPSTRVHSPTRATIANSGEAGDAFSPPPHSVAVLPFTNLSGDADQEYFSEGMSEELINALSHVASLRVAARTSSFSFRNQNADIGTIARKLNVAAILEGSIRRSGNTVRITAQLIDAVNGYHLWSEDYDRDIKDVLALQSDVAGAVARQLQVKLLGSEQALIGVGGTHNPEAYDAYLRGLQLLAMADSDKDSRDVLRAADRAIALDPGYAAALVLRVNALWLQYANAGDSHERDRIRAQARETAQRAVALAPQSAEAHMVLGRLVLLGMYFDVAGAQQQLETAVALAPGDASVQASYGSYQVALGHHELALAAIHRAIALDPENYGLQMRLMRALYFSRLFEEAIVAGQRAMVLKPDGHEVGMYVYDSYLALGQPGLARQMCEQPTSLLDDDNRHECLAFAYHALGETARAKDALSNLMTKYGDSRASSYAEIYAQWGDHPAALQWLATAVRARNPAVVLLRVNWMLDPIRNEPEFKAIEARMNFPP